jgi:uncharacterized protein (DUF58 family)
MKLKDNLKAIVGISLFILALGIITGSPVYYILFGLAGLAAAGFAIYEYYRLYSFRHDLQRRLKIRKELSRNVVFQGSSTDLVFHLNYAGRISRTIRFTQPLDGSISCKKNVTPVKLGPGAMTDFKFTLKPERSGVFRISPVLATVESWLFKDTFPLGSGLSLTVHLPIGNFSRRIGTSDIRANGYGNIFNANIRKSDTALMTGAGIDFLSIRRYNQGDSLKHIDWVRSSRTKDLMVREYENEKFIPAFFIIDVDHSMGTGDAGSELSSATSLVATVITKILPNDEMIGVACFSGTDIVNFVRPGIGIEHISNLRAMLSSLEPVEGHDLNNRIDQGTLPYELKSAFGHTPGLEMLVDETLRAYTANIENDGFSRAINAALKPLNTPSSITVITNLSMGMASLLNGIRTAKYYGHQVSVVLLPHVWHEEKEQAAAEIAGNLSRLRAMGIDAIVMYPGENPDDVVRRSGATSLRAVTR